MRRALGAVFGVLTSAVASPAVIAVVLFSSSSALAGSIYLNGVNIDGVTNQVFQNCTVTIDGAGNIYIAAKGYAVGVPGQAPPAAPVPAPAPAPPPPSGAATTPAATAKPPAGPAPAPPAPATAAASPGVMTQRYWLVTEKAAPGMTQFDIDLFINAKFVRRFLDDEEHVVLELSKFLQPGQNKITFVARKNLADARRSSSPQHYFRIVVGEGDAGGRQVMITKKHIDYKRTALETKDVTDEFYLTTR